MATTRINALLRAKADEEVVTGGSCAYDRANEAVVFPLFQMNIGATPPDVTLMFPDMFHSLAKVQFAACPYKRLVMVGKAI